MVLFGNNTFLTSLFRGAMMKMSEVRSTNPVLSLPLPNDNKHSEASLLDYNSIGKEGLYLADRRLGFPNKYCWFQTIIQDAI